MARGGAVERGREGAHLWGDEHRIDQIACKEGCGLDVLLHASAMQEEKARGHRQHGKRILLTALKEEDHAHYNS